MAGFEKLLRPDERVRRSGGVSPIAVLGDAIKGFAVVALFWLFTRYLQSLSAGTALGDSFGSMTGLLYAILTGLLLLAVAFLVLEISIRALFVKYALTSSRVMRSSLLRTRAADLSHVQDVEIVQGLMGKVLGYGDVIVRTASTEGTLTLRRTARPEEWFREIHEAVRQQQMATSSSS